MSIKTFLKDKIIYIIVQTVLIAFISLILDVLAVDYGTITFIVVCFGAANLSLILYEYIKKATYYNNLKRNYNNLDKKYLLLEIIDEPDFVEGIILYELLKNATKDMNDNIAKYKISSEEYKEYIETWVHEVKTPIAASKLIIENNKNEITKSLNNEINKIDSFVEQALFYSKSNTLESDYIIRKANLDEIVKYAIRRHSKSLIESKISVNISKLDKIVYTDIKWIDFVLGQIITNSIKYKKESPELNFYAKEEDNKVVLSIVDNGVGIPRKDIKKVFDKGFTGENGRQFAKSTGIGLYLCKKLCKKMGLEIKLESQIGEGTKVQITFPKSKMYTG